VSLIDHPRTAGTCLEAGDPKAMSGPSADAAGCFGVTGLRIRRGTSTTEPQHEFSMARDALANLRVCSSGLLRVYRPRPTAAFSRRDGLIEGYATAVAAVEARGFAPCVRPSGGRLAIYHHRSLVLEMIIPHENPRRHIRERFRFFAEAIVDPLRGLGVDARIGPVPGEYCAGDFSINAGGRSKLVGTAQRIVNHGLYFGAIVLFDEVEEVRGALSDAYTALDLPFSPATVGALAEHLPGITMDQAEAVLLDSVSKLVQVEGPV
jgi:octanoyl-[GcvH]:protein N-octanoyltransferase